MSNRILVQWSLLLSACVIGAAGCTAEVHRYIRFPNLFHPGWAKEQRQDAIEHDPYPLNDLGPEVVGGRPREYQQPVNEVERARMFATRPLVARPTTMAPLPTAPPPVVSPPPVVTTPYPSPPAQATPFQVQQRSPY
jgi:hypothetical protein